jgi:hypothetical protein
MKNSNKSFDDLIVDEMVDQGIYNSKEELENEWNKLVSSKHVDEPSIMGAIGPIGIVMFFVCLLIFIFAI